MPTFSTCKTQLYLPPSNPCSVGVPVHTVQCAQCESFLHRTVMAGFQINKKGDRATSWRAIVKLILHLSKTMPFY